ncbi:MAG: hypothetical protein FRX48_00598 [Lasallia pustulata]|uniref:Uncharacterized protein n=1 Tax=Lasallia pustulata TaxID=136370 RepID=A0A5M8Q485_9LECA|nr:MAG: hypothetical protein FRX48_00598 [Lasallia pustulata]
MGRGRATYGNPRTPTSHVYAVQARFVLPPPCVTPQGMSTRAHEVYYLREVLRLTYAEISMRLGMATSGTITRLCRRAAAFLEAQEEVLEAGAYQALLAGVRGEVRQPAAPAATTAAAGPAAPGPAMATATSGAPQVLRLIVPAGISLVSVGNHVPIKYRRGQP